MGKIYAEVELIGNKQKKKLTALLDSGAHRNYARKITDDGTDLCALIGVHTVQPDYPVVLADRTVINGLRARVDAFVIDGFSYKEPELIILENLDEEFIIGAFLMQELGIELDLRAEMYKLTGLHGARLTKLY